MEAAHRDGEDVPAATWLTQLGHVKTSRNLKWSRAQVSFRCGLSPDDDGYLSLLEGRLTVTEAVPLIARGDMAGSADCVRHAEAGSLEKAGFRVVWRPLPNLLGHVAVYSNGEWDDEVSGNFDECFTDFMRGW